MTRQNWPLILGVVLVLQVGLTFAMGLSESDGGGSLGTEPLLSFEAEQVDRIEIRGGDESVALVKTGDAWQIPALDDFPANPREVERILRRLGELKRGWPVASSSGAAERFEVSEDAAERVVVLSRGDDELTSLFVGTSPGFRKVHVRIGGRDEIYAVEFNTFEASAKSGDWIQNEVLRQDEDALARIEWGDLVVTRDGDAWTLPDASPDQEPTEELAALVRRLASLRITGVLGTEAKPEYRQDAPSVVAAFYPAQGEKLELVLSQREEGGSYVVKASDRPHFMELPASVVDEITGFDRSELLRAKSIDEQAGEGAAEGALPDLPASDAAPVPDSSGSDAPAPEAAPPIAAPE